MNNRRKKIVTFSEILVHASLWHLIAIALLALILYFSTDWSRTSHVWAQSPRSDSYIATQPNKQIKPAIMHKVGPAKFQIKDSTQHPADTALQVGKDSAKYPHVLPVQLRVDRSVAQVGEPVRFTLVPESLAINSPFIFIFDFEDGAQGVKNTKQAEIAHEYQKPGTYTVSVSVRRPAGSEIFTTPPTVTNSVKVQVNNWSHVANPGAVKVKQQDSFKINPPSKDLRISSSSNNWWKYLIISLLTLFTVYRVWKWRISQRPTFHSHPDPGTTHLKDRIELAIDFQIRLNPDIAEGRCRLSTHEASFIRSKRIKNE